MKVQVKVEEGMGCSNGDGVRSSECLLNSHLIYHKLDCRFMGSRVCSATGLDLSGRQDSGKLATLTPSCGGLWQDTAPGVGKRSLRYRTWPELARGSWACKEAKATWFSDS